jgi:hypothetical protein
MMPESSFEQEPAAPVRPDHTIAVLESMLALGWQIEPPVLARHAWAQHRTGELAFHIILTRGAQRSLVVIADSPAIRRFLAANDLIIA